MIDDLVYPKCPEEGYPNEKTIIVKGLKIGFGPECDYTPPLFRANKEKILKYMESRKGVLIALEKHDGGL